MGSRGVLFAIEAPVAKRLQDAKGDDDDVMEIIEEIEEAWDEDNLAECDKSWDAMHRVLTDGQLEFGDPDQPRTNLAGAWLYRANATGALLCDAILKREYGQRFRDPARNKPTGRPLLSSERSFSLIFSEIRRVMRAESFIGA